jgi:hypothetical protein
VRSTRRDEIVLSAEVYDAARATLERMIELS